MNNGQRITDNGQHPFIPYARQWIDEDDIQAVVDVLRSDWLTTGPKVGEFEQALADFVGAKEAVAVSSGTAALHAAMYAVGIGPGDEVIVPPMTFAATANAVVFQGGTPVFVDVDPDTLLIDPNEVEAKITEHTKAIIAVDYAGHPCDYDVLREIADRHGLFLVADACHALGAEYKGKNVGTLADLTVFSFHPVKHITTGEGGMVTTDNPEFAERMRLFRNHGITRNPDKFVHRHPTANGQRTTDNGQPITENGQRPTDNGQRSTDNGQRITDNDFQQTTVNGQRTTSLWYYEMQDIGYNYRMTDFQSALGISQLRKLPDFLKRRREIAAKYYSAFSDIKEIEPVAVREDVLHAFHLYVVKIDFSSIGASRTTFFEHMGQKGIGVNVHYIPVHLHPFYRNRFRTGAGLCPAAESAYESIISLPVFPDMSDEDVEKVIEAVKKAVMQ